jgi:hypothetical protein
MLNSKNSFDCRIKNVRNPQVKITGDHIKRFSEAEHDL